MHTLWLRCQLTIELLIEKGNIHLGYAKINIITIITMWLILSATCCILFLLRLMWSRRRFYYLSFKLNGPMAWPLIGNSFTFIDSSSEFSNYNNYFSNKCPNIVCLKHHFRNVYKTFVIQFWKVVKFFTMWKHEKITTSNGKQHKINIWKQFV